MTFSQRSLHHPPGGVGVVRRVCHGHLLRSGTYTHIYKKAKIYVVLTDFVSNRGESPQGDSANIVRGIKNNVK